MKKKRLIFAILLMIIGAFMGYFTVEDKYFHETLKKSNLEDFQKNVIKDDIKLVVLGERHEFMNTYNISLDFLKKLYQTRNTKYFLLEFPPANAEYANRFVLSGNEEYLEKALNFPGIKNKAYKYQGIKFEKFFRDLYKFNKSKSREEKVKLIGIDMEFRPYPFFEFIMTEVIKDKELKDDIQQLLVTHPDIQAKGYNDSHRALLIKIKRKLDKELNPIDKYLIDSAISTSTSGRIKDLDINKRDITISKNIEYISKLFPNQTFILVGGNIHAFKDETNSFTSYTYLLNSNSDYFKGKTLSIDLEHPIHIKSKDLLKNDYSSEKVFYNVKDSKKYNILASFLWPKKNPKFRSNSFEFGKKYSDFYDYLIISD